MTDFGVVHKLDLRDVWKKEATDFTPWLSQHLSDLGDALSMELEPYGQEAPVGEFGRILSHVTWGATV